MTRSFIWSELEAGNGIGLKLLRWTIIILGLACMLITGILELTWPQQAVLGMLMVLLAIWMDRSSSSYLITLTLMLASMYSTFRYGFWRFSTVGKFFLDPSSKWGPLDAFFILVLCFAESYAFAILFLGYLQTMWPLRRTPVPLPDNPDDWPEIDLLIPTYNEPLNIVRYTVLASMNIDWPADKLNIYILDDGKREEFRAFAEEAGVGYMTRDDNLHAKAGNINRALKRLKAPLVAIFDCDHVPTRSFLQVTIGWFLRDQKLGMLQTPHHFYSPDPFERNLGQFRTIPNEGELFYGIVQDGNDFWNATFFCGSCAVLRKTALDEIGGIAVETVTEDAHTSLRMQMNGWNTAYINIPQAAGLATERLSGHVKQRIRWARGMIQIMRTDNPLFCKGLKPAQRLCYFNAMTHFLYALPRLIFLTAPLIYLILGHTNVPGYWAAILAYAFPHLVLSSIANSRIQGQHRHSFWNEIYETVLAPYIFLPTMLAFINPKLGSFNVTAKGGVVSDRFFDNRIAAPFTWMLGINVIGLLCAIPRFLQFPGSDSVFPLNVLASMYDGSHPGTIVMNLIWTLFNMMVLGVATSVAWESQQRRTTVRVIMQVSAHVMLSSGTSISGITADVSSGGVMMETDMPMNIPVGESVRLVFPVLDGEASLPATIVRATGTELRAQFDPLSISEEETLTQVLYSRADTWLGWGEAREPDRPLRSLGRIFALSFQGFKQIGQSMIQRKPKPASMHTSIVSSLLLIAALLGGVALCPAKGFAQTRPVTASAVESSQAVKQVSPGQFDNVFTLADVGVPETIVLRGVDAYHSTYFSVPQTQVVKTATMKLRYHFSPGLLPSISHLKVSINGTLFATLPVATRPNGVAADLTPEEKHAEGSQISVKRVNETSALLEASLTIPADILVHDNQITFEFIGHYTLQCEDPSHSTLWSQVDASSSIELTGSLLPLQDDLKLLPLPFYDAAMNLHPVVPIVFLNQPSPKAMQAAGIVASWFGIMTDYRAVHFPVTFGQIPAGNVIVIGGSASELPQSLKVQNSSGATVAMRTNPSDPYSKVLVITGDRDEDLVTAARALSLQRNLWEGNQVHVTLSPLKKSEPDDAPRWMPTDRLTTLGQIMQTGDLQGDGSVPVGAYMRLPPDLYMERLGSLTFHMEYRYNGIPLANESSLQVYMNGAYVSSTPMPHSEKASAKLSTEIPIPVVNLRPFSQSMMMKFFFQIAKKNKCQDTAPMNLQGAILKDSYLDIRDIPHWAVLPNLELFSNAGYPFTRLKDLSETAVVMPDAPGADEIELFLTMMGHFGAQTGYPVTDVTVTNAEGMKTDETKDYLVLGTAEDQPVLTTLNKSLPVQIQSGGLHVEDTQGFFNPLQHAWWKVRSSDHVQTGQLETAGGLPDALIEGMEWPKGSNRSVVVIALRDQTVIPNFLDTFLRVATTSDIAQSVSVLHGTQFVSYRLGNDVYRVGYLSLWFRMKMLFSEFPALVVVMVLITCFLLGGLMRVALRRKARVRLQGN
ncbi:UDP-forming cellulose synthase catalytic subunit [Terriglobus saanensis]|uniref:Cellulose synthase catalytic subunit [UDP-forming] n=1 Tax=Terriglobus saanensis (strain ATCC BAA-1853 / DSM 23119 / SP1PR4) TaxID=401053 RepID=E8V0S6_TERSS|nr:UDP-forming cellulose synthase catalytic subunit [Terriglobus saanensis]ADV82217.1 cellulose synthase catalytic subunit (UDP-forming) [Terriglobus saanensis SP1PR4]